MPHRLTIEPDQLDMLFRDPRSTVAGRTTNGRRYTARIAIPDYAGNVARRYATPDLDEACRSAAIPWASRTSP